MPYLERMPSTIIDNDEIVARIESFENVRLI